MALRQGLYNEAVFLSASKQQKEANPDIEPLLTKEGPRTPSQDRQLQNGAKAKRNCVIAKLLPPVIENRSEECSTADRPADSSDPQKSAQVERIFHEKPNNQQCGGIAAQQSRSVMAASVEEAATPRIIMSYQDSNSGDEKAGLENRNQQEEADKSGKVESKNSELLVSVLYDLQFFTTYRLSKVAANIDILSTAHSLQTNFMFSLMPCLSSIKNMHLFSNFIIRC